MGAGELFAGIVMIAPLVYSIYLIVKGILYYKSAEEREATVAEISDLEGTRNGGLYYSFSVDIEDDGEIFNIPVEQKLRIKRIEYALKKGDKITVWYLKKYKKCVGNRAALIISGIYLIAIVAAMVAVCLFSLFCVKH